MIVLDILSGVFLALGCFFCIVGGVGLNRLPDFYTRGHAVGVTDTCGAGFVLIGLMFQAPDYLVLTKLIAVMVFLLVTSPISSHAVAKAAWRSGLEPALVEYPDDERPGEPRSVENRSVENRSVENRMIEGREA
ncbi:MAG: multicomponent Na+:H+ antiporter subunit G [Myxococcota bacterium]|jgi:multicomponent Na+:H+ antiporter subunit G